MLVRDWMSPDPMSLAPGTRVGEARRMLRNYGIRHAPVVSSGRVIGIISDRDVRLSDAVLERLAAEGSVAVGDEGTVEDVMSSPAHVIGSTESIEDAARTMLSRRISALPVVDEGALVGIITTTDCLLASLTPTASRG